MKVRCITLSEINESGTFTTSVRMADRLADRIKKSCDRTGASMNSEMCNLMDLGLLVKECKAITIHHQE